MDNCAIHKSAALREVVEGVGCRLSFLPPYSPDLNPIEESFSSCKSSLHVMFLCNLTFFSKILAAQELESCAST